MIGKLTPLWLMADGNREFIRTPTNKWASAFGNGLSFDFDNQPKITPKVSVENFWQDGFSSYSETFETSNPTELGRIIVQNGTFKVIAWTNYFGINFPGTFEASVKQTIKNRDDQSIMGMIPSAFRASVKQMIKDRNDQPIMEMRFRYTTTNIGEIPDATANTKVPLLSQVEDMRLRERGLSENGVTYRSSNGIIRSDPIAESKKNNIHLVKAKGSGSIAPVK